MSKMVDEEFDPRSARAMKDFSQYAESAQSTMVQLRQQMAEFNKAMAMSGVRTQDLADSLKGLSRQVTQSPLDESIEEVRGSLESTRNERASIASRAADRTAMVGEGPSQNVTIQTLRIDVSGVTDKTDKRALAKEISEMVSKEIKSKIGGGMSNTGFSRGV